VLGLPEHKVRVIAPDVGGGFGSKIYLYAEETAMVWAAKRIHRPIKWVAERSESFLSDAHGRDHVTKAELALDKDGKFLAMRVHTIASMGAYLSTFASCIPTILYATLLAGQYTTPAIYAEVTAVFTNTAPVDAYRGAGRPEATYVVERIVHQAAVEMNIPQDELRRRNFIRTFPYQTPGRAALRHRRLRRNARRSDEDGRRQGLRRAQGRSREARQAAGPGLRRVHRRPAASHRRASPARWARAQDCSRPAKFACIPPAASPCSPVRTATARVTRRRSRRSSRRSSASRSRTSTSCTATPVRVLFGMGTYGSRSLAVGGTAIVKAIDKIIAKGKKIAAHLLEASEGDIEFKDGKFAVAGTDRAKTFGEIALTAYVPHNYPHDKLEPGLNETAFYDPSNFTFPAGTHICEVEIDPDTGVVQIANFSACDDFGTIINPMIVEGQVHGGLCQGIGQALLENCVYDSKSGQLLTGSFMDYALPRADDVPSFKVSTKVTPCTHNPLGAKGLRRGRRDRARPQR
jgi:carbon-monoxide dehydrogenase large subunit